MLDQNRVHDVSARRICAAVLFELGLAIRVASFEVSQRRAIQVELVAPDLAISHRRIPAVSLARAQHDSNALVVLRRLGKLVVEGALVPLLSLLGGHFGLVLGPHVEPVVALPTALVLDQ